MANDGEIDLLHDDFIRYLDGQRLAERTNRTYLTIFGTWCHFMLKHGIRPTDANSTILSNFLESRKLSEKTAKHYIVQFSRWYSEMTFSGEVPENPATPLLRTKSRKSGARPRKRLPVVLHENEITTLIDNLRSAGSGFLATRQRALIILLLGTGMRIDEAIHLERQNVVLDARPHIRIVGKGDKERVVPLADDVVRELQGWMELADEHDGWCRQSLVFASRQGIGLSAAGMYRLVRRHFEKAGIVKRKMGPHVLRHTFASRQLAAGHTLPVVQGWLGHEDAKTTSIYLHALPMDGVRPIVC